MTQRERERMKENTADQGLNKNKPIASSFDDLSIKSPCTEYTRILTIPTPTLPQAEIMYKKCFHLINNHILSYKWQRPKTLDC